MRRVLFPSLCLLTACPSEPACEWAALSLEDTAAPADGESSTTLYLEADPRCGRTGLTLTLSHGEMSDPVALDTDGKAELTWDLGNVPGSASATLEAYALEPQQASLRLKAGTPTATWLSTWGSLSGEVSHAWQVERAEQAGVSVIWWSDPVSTSWRERFATPEWDLDAGLDTGVDVDADSRHSWWELEGRGGIGVTASLDSDDSVDDQPGLVLGATTPVSAGRRSWASATWRANEGWLHWPALADIRTTASVRAEPGTGVRLEWLLSDVQPDLKRSLWVIDDNDDEFEATSDDVVVRTQLVGPGFHTVEIDLDEVLADQEDDVDHALFGLRIWAGADPGETVSVTLSGVSIEAADLDGLDDAQADRLAALTGPTHRFAQTLDEDADEALTFLAWGSEIAPIAEGEASVEKGPEALLARLADQGALLGLAHPFGQSWDVEYTGNAALTVQSNTCATLSESELYGVDVLEVGYPSRGTDLSTHLKLWDCLSADQHVVTGVAGEPGITPETAEDAVNPLVTWVQAFDDSEAAQLQALREGRAFFGNPALLADTPSLELVLPSLASMGQVAAALGSGRQLVIAKIKGAQPSDVIQFVVDGTAEDTQLGTDGSPQDDGSRWFTTEVQPTTWTVLRVVVLDVESNLKLASNPIYLSVQDEESLHEALPDLDEGRWPR